MTRPSAASPQTLEPAVKRPAIRLRKAPTLPPIAPPPRRKSDPPPNLSADPDPEWLDETEIRHADPEPRPSSASSAGGDADDPSNDISRPGITEVKSVLTFNRRRRVSGTAGFDATTKRLDRHRLLQQAGFLPVGEDSPTSPTLQRAVPPAPVSEPLPSFPAPSSPSITLQILPTGSTPVLGRAFSHSAVLELVPDSLEADVLAEPPTLTDVGDHSDERAHALSDSYESETSETSNPGLPAFARNEDWGREVYPPSGPASSARAGLEDFPSRDFESGERSVSADSQDSPVWKPLTGHELDHDHEPQLPPLIRFVDEPDEPAVPRDFADISFSDDISLVPDLSGSSPQVRFPTSSGHAGAGGQAASPLPAPPPSFPAAPSASGGFAPLNASTRLVAGGGSFPAASYPAHGGGAFVPRVESPRAYPIVGPSIPVLSGSSSVGYAPRFGYPQSPESGQVSISSDVSGTRRDRSGWTAPLLFLAALVAALAGGFFFLLREPTVESGEGKPLPAAANTPVVTTPATPVATTPAVPAPPVAVQQPSQPAAPAVSPAAPPAPAAPAAVTATTAAPATPRAPVARPAPPPKAAAPAPKKAPRPAGPAGPAAAPADEGPKAMPSPPPPEASPAPAGAPALQGLGELLNGAL